MIRRIRQRLRDFRALLRLGQQLHEARALIGEALAVYTTVQRVQATQMSVEISGVRISPAEDARVGSNATMWPGGARITHDGEARRG